MKKAYSIALLLVFGFAQIAGLLHTFLENHEECSTNIVHVCAPEAHEHCGLCDAVLSTGILSINTVQSSDNLLLIDYSINYKDAVLVRHSSQFEIRGPPSV